MVTFIAALNDGETFELAGAAPFASVREQGETRRVRWIEDNENGTTTVCTTYCGETYTLPNDTIVRRIS